jgi:hypothetical protein
MSDKEVIVLEDSDEGKEATGFITILEAALLMERAEDALAPPLIRFNDPSTADLVVRVMPDGPLLSLHKSIVQANPFFASFRNFAEANGYAEITAPDPETCAFVIECLYHLSTSERVAKFDEIMFQEGVEWFVKHKFSGVLRNASFFMMDALLSRCYLLYLNRVYLTSTLGSLRSGSLLYLKLTFPTNSYLLKISMAFFKPAMPFPPWKSFVSSSIGPKA